MPDFDRAFWLRDTLGHPQTCTEGVERRGWYDTCDKVAVAVRIDPNEGEPYAVCARHARGEMVSLEEIVRFLLKREEAQGMIARGLVALAASPSTRQEMDR